MSYESSLVMASLGCAPFNSVHGAPPRRWYQAATADASVRVVQKRCESRNGTAESHARALAAVRVTRTPLSDKPGPTKLPARPTGPPGTYLSAEPPSLLPHATERLAQFATHVQFAHIPSAVVERIKTCVLDSLGCAIFGATLPWTQSVRAVAEAEGASPVASIAGSGHKTSVALAVLVNATACHAYELDDIHKESILHPGSLAVPVALALAEAGSACSGQDVLTAIVVGYEVGTRVGSAATMSLFLRGFHPQGTSGAFVAAATAGRMLGLDDRQMHHALGIAGSQAGGLMAAQEGAMVKRFHSGRAAQGGVYAAQLAQRGLTGIDDVLEASYGGFLSSFSDDPRPRRLTEGLGSIWETLNVGFKPYASVTSIHSALDALDATMRTNDLSADDIASIEVGVSRMTYVHCAWEYRAQGVTAAQMNLFYGLAVMALERNAFVDQYREDRLASGATLGFIRRIAAHVDEDIDAMGPEFRHACRLRVRTLDGREYQQEVLHRRGSPEVPLTTSEVEQKFRNLVSSCLTLEHADRMVELVARLDELEDTTELTTLLGAQSRNAG